MRAMVGKVDVDHEVGTPGEQLGLWVFGLGIKRSLQVERRHKIHRRNLIDGEIGSVRTSEQCR